MPGSWLLSHQSWLRSLGLSSVIPASSMICSLRPRRLADAGRRSGNSAPPSVRAPERDRRGRPKSVLLPGKPDQDGGGAEPGGDAMYRQNLMKSKMRAGRSVIGPWLATASPAVAELMGHLGYDFLIVDNEHGQGDFG